VELAEELRERVEAAAAAVAASCGLALWEVTVKRGPRGWLVKVTLDRSDGFVGVGECAEVNVRLRARLELENVLAGEFDLEVSSPGLDRPLRTPAEFRRFRGMLARLQVKGALRPEVVVGRIVNVAQDFVELDVEAGRRRFPFRAVAEARLEPELPGFEKRASTRKKALARPGGRGGGKG
jgi:ribosome maturation factor RimP